MSLPEFVYPDWSISDVFGALTTTRVGGVSQAPYDQLNLGGHVGDDPRAVETNRALLAERAGLDADRICWLKQVHGVCSVESLPDNLDVQADASWSRQAKMACAIMTADCMPLLIADPEYKKVAAVHAGWRGLANNIIGESLRAFDDVSTLHVWMGPSIGPNHFEVGQDVYDSFVKLNPVFAGAFRAGKALGKYYLDLYQIAREQLDSLGVENIYGGEYCTYSQKDLFFSYRRDGTATGRMASLIWIK